MKGPELGTTDVYHANTLRVLPATPLGLKDPRFRKGNWMICLREVSLVAIIDKDTKKVVWGWGPGVLDHPHSPVMMPDGQIVVFDNGMNRGYSRLVKMNPATGKMAVEFMLKLKPAAPPPAAAPAPAPAGGAKK